MTRARTMDFSMAVMSVLWEPLKLFLFLWSDFDAMSLEIGE